MTAALKEKVPYCTVPYCTVLYCTVLYYKKLENLQTDREQADGEQTDRDSKIEASLILCGSSGERANILSYLHTYPPINDII